jgi:hypothetical protein
MTEEELKVLEKFFNEEYVPPKLTEWEMYLLNLQRISINPPFPPDVVIK